MDTGNILNMTFWYVSDLNRFHVNKNKQINNEFGVEEGVGKGDLNLNLYHDILHEWLEHVMKHQYREKW